MTTIARSQADEGEAAAPRRREERPGAWGLVRDYDERPPIPPSVLAPERVGVQQISLVLRDSRVIDVLPRPGSATWEPEVAIAEELVPHALKLWIAELELALAEGWPEGQEKEIRKVWVRESARRVEQLLAALAALRGPKETDMSKSTKTTSATSPFRPGPSPLDATKPNGVPAKDRPRKPMIDGVVPTDLVTPVSPSPGEHTGPVAE